MIRVSANETLADASEDEVMALCGAVASAATGALGMVMICALDAGTGCFLLWPDPTATMH